MNIPQQLLPQTEEDAVDYANPIVNENNQIIKDAVLQWCRSHHIGGTKASISLFHNALGETNAEAKEFLEKAYYNSFKKNNFDR
jgi:hypothetical protein